jgi:small subunit ribosomal protein S16
MATVIRLQRGGRKKQPFYSIVVMDSRDRRDGAFIEKIGYFDPCKQPEVIKLDQERARHWIARGAVPSERVASLLRAVEQGASPAKDAGPASAGSGTESSEETVEKASAGQSATGSEEESVSAEKEEASGSEGAEANA